MENRIRWKVIREELSTVLKQRKRSASYAVCREFSDVASGKHIRLLTLTKKKQQFEGLAECT